MKARVLNLDIELTEAAAYSSSPDMRGLVATAKTRDELVRKLPGVIELTFKALGESVSVHEAEGGSSTRVVFVVVPRAALGRTA